MLDRKLEEMGDCGEEDTTAVTEAATDNRMAVESAQPSPEVLQKEKLIRLLKKEVLHLSGGGPCIHNPLTSHVLTKK